MSDIVSITLTPEAINEIYRWWKHLHHEEAPGPVRAQRAALRRCHDLSAVTMTEGYQRLYRKLADGQPEASTTRNTSQNLRLAAIVGLLAHVKDDAQGDSLAKDMSNSDNAESEGRAPVSPLRFRRLLDSPDVDALFVGVRRVLPLTGFKVSVNPLISDIFYWGDDVKKRWAYGYRWPDDKKND